MPAALIPALIMGGSAIAGAAISSSGQKDAAQTLGNAGAAAAPAIDAATTAAQQSGQAGIDQANAALDKGVDQSRQDVNGALGTSLTGLNKDQADAWYALLAGRDNANALLSPYVQAGGTGLNGISDMMSGKFDVSSIPGLQFQMQQGQQALERSAAARGGALGGGAAKSLLRYSQGLASQEYGKEWDRRMGLAGLGLQASTTSGNNDMNSANQQAGVMTDFGKTRAGLTMGAGNTLAEIASQSAANKANIAQGGNQYIGSMGLQGATAAANTRIGAANAMAAGQIGSSNAWAQGLSGLGNAAMLYALMQNQKKP